MIRVVRLVSFMLMHHVLLTKIIATPCHKHRLIKKTGQMIMK